MVGIEVALLKFESSIPIFQSGKRNYVSFPPKIPVLADKKSQKSKFI